MPNYTTERFVVGAKTVRAHVAADTVLIHLENIDGSGSFNLTGEDFYILCRHRGQIHLTAMMVPNGEEILQMDGSFLELLFFRDPTDGLVEIIFEEGGNQTIFSYPQLMELLDKEYELNTAPGDQVNG